MYLSNRQSSSVSQGLFGRWRAIFNLNDPRWGDDKHGGIKNSNDQQDKPPGGRPGRVQGPPDLDELWKDFERRLNALFGGKKGGKGGDDAPRDTPPDNRVAGVGLVVLAIIAVLVWVMSGIFIVQEGQQGIVLQFGRYKSTSPAGINWRLPWPMQSHELVNVSNVRSVDVGGSNVIKAANLKDASMLTEDENIIDVRFAVQYRLKDPVEYLFNNRDNEATVKLAAETAVREIVGRHNMDFVLYEGREKIALDMNQSIQRILDSYKSGISVTSVTMHSVQPPEQVQAAFDDAVKAGQDRERLKNEGQAYANDVIPRARGAAARLLQEAEGYKAKVVSQAEGDASRFKQVLAEYSKAPQVTRDRLYLDAMQQIYSTTTKVLVDVRQGNNLLYLPLDKLIAHSYTGTPLSVSGQMGPPAPNATGAPPSNAPEATPTNATEIRTRDVLRSRDREIR